MRIAEAFDMAPNEFLMQARNMFIDPDEDDDKYLKDIGYIHLDEVARWRAKIGEDGLDGVQALLYLVLSLA